MGELVRIVWSSPPPPILPAVFIPLRPLLFLRLTWRDRRLRSASYFTWSKTPSSCSALYFTWSRTFSLALCVLFFIEDSGRARGCVHACMCMCVCARWFFFFFSCFRKIRLYQVFYYTEFTQNEIRSPWDSNFLWLIYPAVIRASFAFFCRFICRIPAMPFSSVCTALTSRTFISPRFFVRIFRPMEIRRILFFGILLGKK